MSQVDRINGLTGSVAVKVPCKAATQGNITLSGIQTIDGVAGSADDRCLVMNQTVASENGIYNQSASAWSRALDFNGARDIAKGTTVRVTDGTASANKNFGVTTASPVIGTSAIAFAGVGYSGDVSAFMGTVLDDTTASEARSTLGVAIGSDVQSYDENTTKNTEAQTLTLKTLTNAVLNGSASGTAILDEDGMSSDSDTKLATQQSIKAYVDSKILVPTYKYKTTQTSRASTVTLADDPHLAGWTLLAASYYKIEGVVKTLSEETTGAGAIKYLFTLNNAPQDTCITFSEFKSDGAARGQAVIVNISTEYVGDGAISADLRNALTISGFFYTHATLDATLNLQWAQGLSDAEAQSLEKGSWISVTKIS